MMKRRFLIVVETVTTVVSAIYALIVGFGWASPANLLVFTFLTGAAGAMTVLMIGDGPAPEYATQATHTIRSLRELLRLLGV